TTGHGEGMIRLVVAKSIADAVAVGGAPAAAVREVLGRLEARLGSRGGAIAATADGRFGLARSAVRRWGAGAGDGGDGEGIWAPSVVGVTTVGGRAGRDKVARRGQLARGGRVATGGRDSPRELPTPLGEPPRRAPS